MSKVTATSFENVSPDIESPTMATHFDWDLAVSHEREWQIDAQRGTLQVPMRLAYDKDPSEVAAYVREQLDWIDAPPVPELEEAEG